MAAFFKGRGWILCAVHLYTALGIRHGREYFTVRLKLNLQVHQLDKRLLRWQPSDKNSMNDIFRCDARYNVYKFSGLLVFEIVM